MTLFCPLASGSKGNCTYIGTNHTKILVDAGIPTKHIKKRLEEIHVALEDIQAILITHEHQDHIQGLNVLAFKLGIPVIANYETAKAIAEYFHDCPKFKIFSTSESFEFQDFEIQPFSVKHDAVDPVAFSIKTERHKIGICTDLGLVTAPVVHHLQQCDILHVEANHEPSMVHGSSRPIIYKERVLGPTGHLSNAASGELIAKVYHPNIQQIYLAHLSTECNSEQTAIQVITTILQSNSIAVELRIAYQEQMSRATQLQLF